MVILSFLLKLVVQAAALVFAIEMAAGTRAQNNKFGRALTVTVGLGLAGVLFGMVPFVGWFLSMIFWCAVVMATYKISLWRSAGVAVLQLIIGWGLTFVLKLVGVLGPNSMIQF